MSSKWHLAERARLFDDIPSGIVVIDPQYEVVDHNRAFGEIFGQARGKTCFAVTGGNKSVCASCPALATFADGQPRVIEQTGIDCTGRKVHYLARMTRLSDDDGETGFVAAVITDLTDTRRLQQEYQTLFERVPCFVAVINRDRRVVKANQAFRRVFGEPTGEPCYRHYKRSHHLCPDCPADKTFRDGSSHVSHQIGVSVDGRTTPYLVFTSPLLSDEGEPTHVIEMALDMTEHQNLEKQLSRANVMRTALVENSHDAIVVFDEKQRILLANRAAEELIGVARDKMIGLRAPPRLVPRQLSKVLRGTERQILLHETELATPTGTTVPVRMAAVALDGAGAFMGSAVIAQDLREIKRLEHDMLEAERMAAVGQTVAGLAHGIKNIITGLEGGMYVTSTGLKRGDQERIRLGWEMLVRNMSRISDLTKNLLAFSRGDVAHFSLMNPSVVARDVVDLYSEGARGHGIELGGEIEAVADAYMDPDGLHSCLANLISNAVDACVMSDQDGCTITVRLFEQDNTLIFEVTDSGCGMDYEVKQKAFTSFFTTKGQGGTGLGLLITHKIVQQHGGAIALESKPGQGTTFRLRFPRSRLPTENPNPKEVDDD